MSSGPTDRLRRAERVAVSLALRQVSSQAAYRRAWAELAPVDHRLADGIGATSLAGGQVGSFETQCVVFVFGDAFLMSRRFMGRPRSLFGLQQVFGEPFQHLLLKH